MTVVLATHADHVLKSHEIYWVSKIPGSSRPGRAPSNELDAVVGALQAQPGRTALIDSVPDRGGGGTVSLTKALKARGCEATQRLNPETRLVDVYARWPEGRGIGD